MIRERLTKILGMLVALGVLGGVFGISIIIYFSFTLPKISKLSDYSPPIMSQILAKDGTVLASIGKEKRDLVNLEDVPPLIIDSFLSAEDSQFYEHTGVDYLGVIRAMIANIKAGRVVQGGSTITQQVAKSLLLSSERSFTRKIKDFLLAQRIEKKLTKKEILYLYLNQVYLGGGYYGVKSAFKGYFGKELSEATVAESAMVAGLLVAPGKYSPYINPSRAKKRQGYVLSRLLANKKISKEDYDQAIKEKIKYRIRKPSFFKAGYFTDWIRQRVIEKVGEENFKTNGFTVVTTLDWDLQKVAEEEVMAGVKAIDKRQGYKGPLGNVAEDGYFEFFQKQRKDIYNSNSNFFTIDDEKKKVYELELGLDELETTLSSQNETLTKIKYKRFYPGYKKDDPFLQQVKVGENYKAIVLKVYDPERLVVVSIGGVVGLMGYEQFNWAHERLIQEEKHFYPYITRPSTVLKEGDIVLVKVQGKKNKFHKTMRQQAFDKRLKSNKELSKIAKENYLLCLLDQEPDAQAALVSIKPSSGEIVSFVGGSNFRKSQFNRAIQSKRQPGSSFKPLLFAAGLENGYTPSTIIIDSPEALGGYDATLNWKPRNYDGKFKGPITFRNSLEQSRNIPTIKIAEKLGVPGVTQFMNRIGFVADMDKDLSLALGSFGVTLMDMTATYGVFPNGGKLIKVKSIVSVTDRNGETYVFEEEETEEEVVEEALPEPSPTEVQVAEEDQLEENGQPVEGEEVEEEKVNPFLEALGGDQVYDPRLAYIMSNLMRGVVLHGTGRGAKSVSQYLGGKTGTTNSYVDAWFTGFSSNIVTGVWTGFDDNKTLGWGETGAKSALPIWKGFMDAALKKFGEYEFKQPLGIVNVLVDKETGKQSRYGNSRAFMEAFVEGTEPGRKVSEVEEEKKEDSNTQFFEEDDYYNNQ